MIKNHFEESDDDEDEWRTLYGFAEPGRYYITYGGGPSGGIVRFRNHGWYEWRQGWGGHKVLTPIPDGKVIIWRPETDEYSEAIKIVDGAYDLREDPYDEYYLDDLEDSYIENNPEAELIHPDDMEEDEEDENEDMEEDEEDESDDEMRANFQSMAMNYRYGGG